MHISLRYACLICRKKFKRKHGSDQSIDEIKTNPKFQELKLKHALQQASEFGSICEPQNIDMENNGLQRSRSLARLEAQKEFLKATSLAADTIFITDDSIDDLDLAFHKFLTMYPNYKSSEKIDELRVNEYAHLADNDSKVCLDYCGFGLFSFFQVVSYCESCSFTLSEITSNLTNHALFNGIEQGTMEHDVKTRIMDYLNIPENEYGFVLTASRGSAFKLLAESFPFNNNKSLLTMFDHESQSVNWMAQRAKQKGAKVHSAWFKWPTLKPCSTHLRKRILNKKRRAKDSSKGLFVFPVQSRVTGAKYSYQWMSFAQQNNWHVLLDAGALGPLDMDSLGLSLFRPDFIITSFYRVFGYDPTGFGCLLIKKSVIKTLQKQSGRTSSGIVRINPVFSSHLSYCGTRDDEGPGITEVTPEAGTGNQLPAFSGVLTPSLMKDVYEPEPEPDTEYVGDEETGIFSVMKSPILTEEESPEDSMWIDLGPSPLGSESMNFKSPVPPPNWFTRKNNINKFDSQPHESESYIIRKAEVHSPEIQEVSEIESSVIRRETEGDFMLFGRRTAFNFDVEDEYVSEEESGRKEPEITCRHLDHVSMLGLGKTTIRLRFLINWLVTSLLQLRLPGSSSEDMIPLVRIYGPKIKYERGAAVAFNIRDGATGVISPEVVQKMAEENGICLGVAIISNVKIIQSTKQNRRAMEVADTAVCRPMDDKNHDLEGFVRAEVVTASLGFLTNFEDVYKLWAFVARFLNPSFVRQYGLSTLVEGEEV